MQDQELDFKAPDFYIRFSKQEFVEFGKSKELKMLFNILRNTHTNLVQTAINQQTIGINEEQALATIKKAASILNVIWDIEIIIRSFADEKCEITPAQIADGVRTLVIPLTTD